MPPALQIRLLGAFHLRLSDEAVKGFDQARLQEFLAYLLLHAIARAGPVPRQQLAFLFWPDSTEEQARTNLRNLWHRLRRALPDAERYLAADELAIQWRPGAACWLDVAEFEDHVRQAGSAAGADDRVQHLEQAVATYGGELLPGCYSDWLLAERERLAQAYGGALEQLVALYEGRRDYRRALGHAQALLRHDPLHEPAYAHVMRLNALNDDRAAALHTYHTCVTVLRRELDVEPSQTTRELYEQLLNVKAQPAAAAPAEASAPLTGRDTEWALLQRAWREAARRPRVALIAGEAGIGKTRLAEAFVEWVGRQGMPALTARCYAAGGELAYAPVVTWLRSLPRPPLPDVWLRELARLLPEILIERPKLPPPEPLAENWQRLRLFEALSHALHAGRPAVLLFLDDLQWCDRDTLDWLHFLLTARGGQGAAPRLLLIATVRAAYTPSEEDGNRSAIDAWQAGLVRTDQLSEIELGPLSQEAALALADHIAGRPFDRVLGPLLYQGTEGHPLFIVEMVRAGFARTALPSAQARASHAAAMLQMPTTLPARVRQVLEARLAQLSAPAHGMIELAAVIGRAFTHNVLAAASDLSEDLLVSCLDECWRKRIIREQGEDAYDFSHDKLREVAYAGLSRTRRRWLHGQVAGALERVHAAALDNVAGVIAGHYEAANMLGPAITFYDRAAAADRRIYAHRDALAALEKALELVTALADDAARPRLAAHLQEQVGDLRELLAQHGPARDAYIAALAAAPYSNPIAHARLHRKIGKTLESERAGYPQVAAQYAAAEALLGAPGENAEPAWWDEWCQIQIEHLILLYWWNRPADMAQQIERVQPLIEQHGTPFQRAALYGNLSRQQSRSCRFAPSDAAVASARAALAVLPPATGPEVRAPYQFSLGFCLLWHDDHVEAERELRLALALAEQTGDVTLQARCLTYLAVAHRRQRHDAEVEGPVLSEVEGLSAVEGFARRGLAVAEAAGMPEYVGACRANLAWLAWRRGVPAEAERLGQAALAAWQKHALPYPLRWQALWPLIGAALAQDRPADAIAHVRQLCDPVQQALPPDIEAPLLAAINAWDAGRPDAARDLLFQAVELAQRMNLS